MLVKIFNIPVLDSDRALECLNKFLGANKVVSIDKQFYQKDGNPYWTIFVVYIPSGVGSYTTDKKEKVDYKTILSEDEFIRFAKLRTIRKKIADSDAVPAYAVFTDAELAEISRSNEIVPPMLSQIKGVGPRRVEKYGVQLCQMYNSGEL